MSDHLKTIGYIFAHGANKKINEINQFAKSIVDVTTSEAKQDGIKIV